MSWWWDVITLFNIITGYVRKMCVAVMDETKQWISYNKKYILDSSNSGNEAGQKGCAKSNKC